MRAFEVGADERVVFAFTHPDDELALSALIGRLIAKGVALRVIWTHSTHVREAESRAAMRTIGVKDSDLAFYETEDGNVIASVSELREPFSKLVEEFRPTRIVTHAFEQGHIDHDATNLLVNLCFKGPVFEAPFYHTYLTRFPRLYSFSSPEGEQTMALTPSERRTKKRLVGLYPSQTVRRNIIVYELLHALTFRRPPLFRFERLRLQTHKDFLSPNHPEPLAGRIRACETWERWERGASALL